jgi:hypothetical protein
MIDDKDPIARTESPKKKKKIVTIESPRRILSFEDSSNEKLDNNSD